MFVQLHRSNSRPRWVFGLLGVVLCAQLLSAQTPPNFSGTWEPVRSSDPVGTMAVQTIRQTATTLTIGHDSGMGGHKFVYRLDGSENYSTLMNIESRARVSLDTDKLTINRVDEYPDGRIRETTQVWSLDSDGNLVIDGTDRTRGETPIARKLVYRKRVLLKN